jgi:hypothetical protein
MRRNRDFTGSMACFVAGAWSTDKMLTSDTAWQVALFGAAALYWLLWGLALLITYGTGE